MFKINQGSNSQFRYRKPVLADHVSNLSSIKESCDRVLKISGNEHTNCIKIISDDISILIAEIADRQVRHKYSAKPLRKLVAYLIDYEKNLSKIIERVLRSEISEKEFWSNFDVIQMMAIKRTILNTPLE